jgi:hypothetical protein
MKLKDFLLSAMLVFLPLSAMAQQSDSLAPAGKSPAQSESLAVKAAKPAGDSAAPAMNVLGYDPIGDEEEMDSMENMESDDSMPFWMELDPDRDYDPPDQREREQEQDGRD